MRALQCLHGKEQNYINTRNTRGKEKRTGNVGKESPGFGGGDSEETTSNRSCDSSGAYTQFRNQ